MSENKESNNTGCIICIVLFVVANLIYFFTTESSESIAKIGEGLLTIAGVAIAYFVCKALFGSKSKDTESASDVAQTATATAARETSSNGNSQSNNSYKSLGGCILTGIACIVIAEIIVASISSSFNLNYAVGVAFAVVLAIVIGYFIYTSFKD